MAPGELEVQSAEHSSLGSCSRDGDSGGGGDGVLITCFTEVLDDVTLHFQIIRLHKQIYAWIGSNSAKFGNLYASAPTQPDKTSNWEGDPPGELAVPKPTQVLQRRKELSGNNTVSVTNILGGGSDNAGSGIARRIVLKTGLNVILACSIPKNSLMLEVDAEKMLVQKLINLGYARPKSEGSSS